MPASALGHYQAEWERLLQAFLPACALCLRLETLAGGQLLGPLATWLGAPGAPPADAKFAVVNDLLHLRELVPQMKTALLRPLSPAAEATLRTHFAAEDAWLAKAVRPNDSPESWPPRSRCDALSQLRNHVRHVRDSPDGANGTERPRGMSVIPSAPWMPKGNTG